MTLSGNLILQMGSPGNAVARETISNLRSRGWGFGNDRSLVRVNFRAADLEGTNLEEAIPENAKDSGEQPSKTKSFRDASQPDGNIVAG